MGNELFKSLQLKLKTLVPQIREQHTKNGLLLDVLKETISSQNAEEDIQKLQSLERELLNRQNQLNQELTKVENIQKELLALKQGSVAKIQQITTISKMRIYNPKNSSDPLYGIRFSEETMKLINAKLKDFFVFDE